VLRSVHLGTGESNHTVLSPRLAPAPNYASALGPTYSLSIRLLSPGLGSRFRNDSGADLYGSRRFAVVGFKFGTLMDIQDPVVAEVCPSSPEQGIPSRACNSALVTIMLG
jgi:hypothetical protein